MSNLDPVPAVIPHAKPDVPPSADVLSDESSSDDHISESDYIPSGYGSTDSDDRYVHKMK